MVFNATFNNISVYGGGRFYWWRKPEYRKKLPTCRCIEYTSPWTGFELTTLVVMGTNYTGIL